MFSKVGAFALGAVLFFIMSWISLEWSSLKPSLLWLSTGAVTTVALYVGSKYWWRVIAGDTLGGAMAGPVLFDDTWPEMLAVRKARRQ